MIRRRVRECCAERAPRSPGHPRCPHRALWACGEAGAGGGAVEVKGNIPIPSDPEIESVPALRLSHSVLFVQPPAPDARQPQVHSECTLLARAAKGTKNTQTK